LNSLIQSSITNCSNTNEDIDEIEKDLNNISNQLVDPNYQEFAFKIMVNLMRILEIINEAEDAYSNKDYKKYGNLSGQALRIIFLEWCMW